MIWVSLKFLFFITLNLFKTTLIYAAVFREDYRPKYRLVLLLSVMKCERIPEKSYRKVEISKLPLYV